MFPSKSKVFEDIYKKINVSIIFLNSKVKGMGRKKVGICELGQLRLTEEQKSKLMPEFPTVTLNYRKDIFSHIFYQFWKLNRNYLIQLGGEYQVS